MNIFKSAGFAIGILISIIVIVILFKFANSNHRSKTEYDERQKVIRGQAYMYGFYAMLIYECLMILLRLGGITLPMEDYLLHVGAVFFGSIVLACYSIWNDVYWGLNNNRKRYGIVMIVLAMINALPVVGSLKEGTLFTKGENVPIVNLMVLVLMLVMGVTFLLKHLTDSRKNVEEE